MDSRRIVEVHQSTGLDPSPESQQGGVVTVAPQVHLSHMGAHL